MRMLGICCHGEVVTVPGPRRLAQMHNQLLARTSLARATARPAGPIMDMKVQCLRSGKVLGIGELLASTCSASATLDRS